MNLAQSLTYTFDDPQWFAKLLAAAALGFMTLLLMPLIFLGLVPFAVMLGYMLEIVKNMRGEKPKAHPLPMWADLSILLYQGGTLLLAMIVYNIPVILLTTCMATLPRAFGTSITTGVITLAILCCMLPVLVGYVLIIWTMLAVGVARYTRNGSGDIFYRVGLLFEDAQNLGTHSLQWVMATLIVNLCLFILLFIPIAGWFVILSLAIPVHGHLLGQYTRQFDRYTRQRRAASPS